MSDTKDTKQTVVPKEPKVDMSKERHIQVHWFFGASNQTDQKQTPNDQKRLRNVALMTPRWKSEAFNILGDQTVAEFLTYASQTSKYGEKFLRLHTKVDVFTADDPRTVLSDKRLVVPYSSFSQPTSVPGTYDQQLFCFPSDVDSVDDTDDEDVEALIAKWIAERRAELESAQCNACNDDNDDNDGSNAAADPPSVQVHGSNESNDVDQAYSGQHINGSEGAASAADPESVPTVLVDTASEKMDDSSLDATASNTRTSTSPNRASRRKFRKSATVVHSDNSS